MAIDQSFPAHVTDEGVIFDDHDAMLAHVETLLNQRITVTFSAKPEKRSAAQLRWLFGVALPRIADKCGYDRHEHDRLHYDLLSIRFGTKAVPSLIKEAPPRIVPTSTSSDLSPGEMSDYMEWVVRYAAEHLDCYVPLPDDVD